MIDTPASAMPSRFMNNEFLPSPSSFYREWNLRGNDDNTLPSPLNFSTPTVAFGPSSFYSEDIGKEDRKKRKWDQVDLDQEPTESRKRNKLGDL